MNVFRPEDLLLWTGGRWSTPPTSPITGICHDTRALDHGSLYVAIAGGNFDGHDFVAAALNAGASAALVNEDYEQADDAAGPLLFVPDTKKALGKMAAGYRNGLKGRFIAVTGSVGKTSVKEMTAGILARSGLTARTQGNWNNDIGLPLSILSAPSEAEYGVFEVGMNRPGEIAALCRILRPSSGIMTQVGTAHLQAFVNEEAIAREKAAMLASLPDDGYAVLAKDTKWFRLFAETAPCALVTVSMSGDADYVGIADPVHHNTLIVEDRRHSERSVYALPLPGSYVKQNALLAVAAAREYGIDPGTIAGALSEYKAPPMRWQESELGGMKIINDAYNANPVSMRAAIEAFGDLESQGGKWLVLSGMFELGDAEQAAHAALGEYVAGRGCDGLVTVGKLGKLIADGARGAGLNKDRVFCCSTHLKAASVLQHHLRAGDAVLLKGSRAEHLEHVLEEWDNLRNNNC